MKHRIDPNAIKYVKRLGHNPLGALPCPVDKKTGKINPQVTRFLLRKEKDFSVYIDVAHIKPIYYETLSGHWRPLSEICEFHGNRNIVLNKNWRMAHPRFINWLSKRQELLGAELLLPTPFGAIPSPYQNIARPEFNVGLTITTVYPDPNPETTTVDGMVTTSSASFAAARAATSGTANDTATATGSDVQCSLFSAVYYFGRGFFLFDSSSIDDTDEITDAVFSQYASGSYADADGVGFDAVQTSPASNTAIVGADYNNLTFTSGGNRAIKTSAGYADVTLNATGLTWISKTGITKLGLIGGADLANSAPSGLNRDAFSFSEASGTSQDPKLAITHIAGSGSSGQNSGFLMFM